MWIVNQAISQKPQKKIAEGIQVPMKSVLNALVSFPIIGIKYLTLTT